MADLLSLTHAELEALVTSMGEGKYRARQLYQWLLRGAEFDEMTNLSSAFREKLKQSGSAMPLRIIESIKSELDGTEKYLYRLTDGNVIEGVRMSYSYGDTLCVSTQVGCKMGCKFCASTLGGCVRNLTAGEMLGQVISVNRRLRETVGSDKHLTNLVLMGSGEPLDNYDNVMKFLRLLNRDDGIHMSLRNVSLSTCGLVPQMYRLADEGLPVTLCVSLHAPNDEIRRRTMPIANKYSIAEIMDACRNYIDKTGRRVIFEYALVDEVNCSKESARELAHLLRGMQCHVNLIPLNAVPERDLNAPSAARMKAFERELTQLHISVSRRREMGDDIGGACGQLRRAFIDASAEDD